MILNGVMTLILRYFTEFVYDVVVKQFTFAISSDEFLVCIRIVSHNVFAMSDELSFLCDTGLLLSRIK